MGDCCLTPTPLRERHGPMGSHGPHMGPYGPMGPHVGSRPRHRYVKVMGPYGPPIWAHGVVRSVNSGVVRGLSDFHCFVVVFMELKKWFTKPICLKVM